MANRFRFTYQTAEQPNRVLTWNRKKKDKYQLCKHLRQNLENISGCIYDNAVNNTQYSCDEFKLEDNVTKVTAHSNDFSINEDFRIKCVNIAFRGYDDTIKVLTIKRKKVMLKLKDKLNTIEHIKRAKIRIYRLEYIENLQEKRMYSLGKCIISYVKNNDSMSLEFQNSLDNKRNFHPYRISKIATDNNNQIQLRIQGAITTILILIARANDLVECHGRETFRSTFSLLYVDDNGGVIGEGESKGGGSVPDKTSQKKLFRKMSSKIAKAFEYLKDFLELYHQGLCENSGYLQSKERDGVFMKISNGLLNQSQIDFVHFIPAIKTESENIVNSYIL
ncbi:hypothetical protein WN51_09242 [Melipona quadrifasciata]|uniref:Uncharacterized protein n=1 Tax=Melipona quadrifasciata TaxID=166423 RepID=A0A0M8ZQA8_9HYME|nr:hypothetical protein WN51_09242 [Melipona quadrifasciata]